MTDPISQFLINNPTATRDETLSDLTHSIIKKPWNDPSIFLDVKHGGDLSWINDIYLPPELVAIDHKSKNTIEFIYTYMEVSELEKTALPGIEWVCTQSHRISPWQTSNSSPPFFAFKSLGILLALMST